MNPNDWQKGMENEAASVEDARWARKTRWAARRAGQRHQWLRVTLWNLILLGVLSGVAAFLPASRVPYVGLLLMTGFIFLGGWSLAMYQISLPGTLLNVLLLGVAVGERTSPGAWGLLLLASLAGWHVGRGTLRAGGS